MTALLLVWKFDSGATMCQDFTYDGDLSALCKEVATHIDIVDNSAAMWRGVAGDFQREVWRLEQQVRDKDQEIEEQKALNRFALEKMRPLREAAK